MHFKLVVTQPLAHYNVGDVICDPASMAQVMWDTPNAVVKVAYPEFEQSIHRPEPIPAPAPEPVAEEPVAAAPVEKAEEDQPAADSK